MVMVMASTALCNVWGMPQLLLSQCSALLQASSWLCAGVHDRQEECTVYNSICR